MIEAVILFQVLALLTSQSLMDVGSFAICIVALISWFRKAPAERPSLRTGLEVMFFLWIFGIGAGLFLQGDMTGREWSLFLEFRWVLEMVLWSIAFRLAKWRPVHGRWFLGLISFCSILALMTFVSGRLFFDDHFRFVLFDATVIPYDSRRVGGLFNNPMPFAHTYGPLASALFAFWLTRPGSVKLAVATFSTLSATFLSLTRGIWLGLAGAMGLSFLHFWGKRGVRPLLVVGLVATMFVGLTPSLRSRALESFDSSRSYDFERLNIWRANLHLFMSHPLFGVGYGRNKGDILAAEYERMGLPRDSFNSHAHNQYLNFLGGTGLWGTLGYLMILGIFLTWTWRLSRDPSWRSWGLALLCYQVCFHIGSLTESNFSIAKNRMALIFVWAMVLAIRQMSRPAVEMEF